VQRTYHLLDQVAEQASKQGAQLVLVSIPASLAVDDDEWARWSQQHAVLARQMDRERPGQLLQGWATQHGVPLLRLRDAFKGRERMYFGHDIHWTTQGHFQAGEKMADFLRRGGYVR
jgi:SGNH hydrolase-like domain, acetyltransferase AlgX